MSKIILLAFGLMPLAAAAPYFARAHATPAAAIFHASGPGGLNIEGKTPDVRVQDDGKVLSVIVPLMDLDTGIDLRNRHMKEKYLEVKKFPDARLNVLRDNLKVPDGAGSIKAKAKGAMTLHGVTRDMPFDYEAKCEASGACHVVGSLELNMNEFDIETPKYLGVKVKPVVGIDVRFDLVRVEREPG